MSRVLEFVASVLESGGAIVEPRGPDAVDAVLPESLRDALGLEELVQLGETEGEGRVPVGFGTETLQACVSLAVGRGRVAAYRVVVPQPTPRRPDHLDGLNVALRAVRSRPESQWILAGLLRYSAVSDDERVGLVRTAVAQGSGVVAPLPDWSSGHFDLEAVPSGRLAGGDIQAILPQLLAALRAEVASELSDLRLRIASRKQRDAERLREYFTEMARDFASRMKGRSEAAFREKIAAIPGELERRMAQLRAECSVRVQGELVALIAFLAPGVTADVEVKRRKACRTLAVRYDGVSRSWLGLRCDGCGTPTARFALCDAADHVLCSVCWDLCGSGGHRPCFRCAGKPERRPWTRELRTSSEPEARPTSGAEPGVASRAAAEADGPSSVDGTTRTTDGLHRLRERVLRVLSAAGRPVPSGELRERACVDPSTLRKALRPLLADGSIRRVGERRGARYLLVRDETRDST